ncbi:MAG: isopentenyl-diphosphate Delta-isomerase [Bacteroidota bacterium]
MDVILVDETDRPIGTMEKMEVHQKALLHRAFSIFIFDEAGEMLLQQRAAGKYHSAGLWTNACCSHPAPGTDTKQAAAQRLQEELGFNTHLEETFNFIYKAPFDNGLTEYEFDHVFTGTYNGAIIPDPGEVSAYVYLPVAEIAQRVESHPDEYTAWFKIAFPKVMEYLSSPVSRG